MSALPRKRLSLRSGSICREGQDGPALSRVGGGREAQFAISWPVVEQLVCNEKLGTVVCERLVR
jgi:hypothetical protein